MSRHTGEDYFQLVIRHTGGSRHKGRTQQRRQARCTAVKQHAIIRRRRRRELRGGLALVLPISRLDKRVTNDLPPIEPREDSLQPEANTRP